MLKVKSLSLPTLGILALLISLSAYAVLVMPRISGTVTGADLVFEEPAIIVKPLVSAPARTSVKGKAAAEASGPETTLAPLPIVPPKAVYRAAPIYPAEARMKGIEGTVVLRALINEKGELLRAQITRSSGSIALDDAAMSALSEWKFSPAARGAGPITSWLEVPFRFILN